MSDHAAFSYAPGEPTYPVPIDSRASVARYIEDATDQAFVYWPGALHVTGTDSRASVARYVEDTD